MSRSQWVYNIHISKNLGINQGFASEGMSGVVEMQDFAGEEAFVNC